MATPVHSSYSAAAGQPIYAGSFAPAPPPVTGRPAWRNAMARDTWALIPGNTLDAVDPALDPAVNPNYPGQAPWRFNTGHTSLISAWGSVCFDKATRTMHLPLSEGHQDGADNSPYKVTIGETANWVRIRNPSGSLGMPAVIYDDHLEGSGVYSDGRLRAAHSYNNHVYFPGIGPIVARLTATFGGTPQSVRKAYKINETTGEATLFSDQTGIAGMGITPYGGTAYDPDRNCIWAIGQGSTELVKITSAGVATRATSTGNMTGGYPKLKYLGGDLLGCIHDSGTNLYPAFFLIDIANNYNIITPAISGSFAAGFFWPFGYGGVDWDLLGNRFLMWFQDTNRAQLSTLTAPANKRTGVWTAGSIPVSGSNTVIPSLTTLNGVMGRFGYDEGLGGCYLLNSTGEQIHFYATE